MSSQRPSDQEVERGFAVAPKYPGSPAVTALTLDVKLVTLLYGGGPIAGYPDDITPFRPSSVRGHLRFWWRATRGARYDTWEELREREALVWGDSDHPSPVRIRVDCPAALWPKRFPLRRYEKDYGRRYALFPPFEEKIKRLDQDRLQEGGGFQLTVSLPEAAVGSRADIRDEIDAALWGWLNFGGLGARTRRGAGALFCPQYAGWDPSKILGDGKTREWPTMKGGILIWGTQPRSWQDCWSDLLKLYREFRQDRGTGGRGKTHWPEPDQIRGLRQRGEKPDGGFPRGVLGLPILFHFKDGWDPPDQTLNVDETGRMASPVILRPFAISENQALPAILILNAPKPASLQLFEGKASDPVALGPRNAIAELVSRVQSRWHTSPVVI